MRALIVDLKKRVMSFVDLSNPRAVSKAEHYIAALDAQLSISMKADETIEMDGLSY